jgi:phospholipid transport system substrate-binding protein
MRSVLLVAALASLLAVPPVRAAAASTPASPSALVRNESKRVLAVLNHAYRTNALRGPNFDRTVTSLERIVLPYFDIPLTGAYVLGRYSRAASPQERARFDHVFMVYLVNQLANALRDYHGGRVVVIPYRGRPTAHYALVRTHVYQPSGKRIAVNYSMVRTETGWKVFDVSVEGVSYVMSYRQQFAPILAAGGIPALVARLQAILRKEHAVPVVVPLHGGGGR